MIVVVVQFIESINFKYNFYMTVTINLGFRIIFHPQEFSTPDFCPVIFCPKFLATGILFSSNFVSFV